MSSAIHAAAVLLAFVLLVPKVGKACHSRAARQRQLHRGTRVSVGLVVKAGLVVIAGLMVKAGLVVIAGLVVKAGLLVV